MEKNRVITLERALNELPLWGISPPQQIHPLRSGLTNRSYLLQTGQKQYILRLNNNNAFKLGISRGNELRALHAIEGEDFAPDVVYACPNFSYLLTKFVEGTSFAEKPPNAFERELLLNIVSYYQNEIEVSLSPISYLYQLQAYYQTALECNVIDAKTAEEWEQFRPQLTEFEASLPPLVFSHNDLTPGNILRHNGGLKIIDWEFSSAGHPEVDRILAFDPNPQDANTPTRAVLQWLYRLWMLIIPHYPAQPEEDARSLEMPPSVFGYSD